jgi:type IV pilus assembly protein PilC
MLKAGVPLLQAFDIVGKGHSNANVSKLLKAVKSEIEAGSSMATAFQQHPKYFDPLFCNLVQAGEKAGILELVLDRLALYKEKTVAIKAKIKSALFYPTAVIGVAFLITAILMIFVIPAFKNMFSSFGGDLPAPTKIVMEMSDYFVANWYFIFGAVGGGIYAFKTALRKNKKFADKFDAILLKMPIFGIIIEKATIARWTRTLATMFTAGVPLVEALDSVGGASGNAVYRDATKNIQTLVQTGTSLTAAMNDAQIFPNMVLQMAAIGEESGALDDMLNKVADFYEDEVDIAVASISSLMEPIIMVILGVLVGGMVIAMYLPIFKMGQAVG